MRQSLADAPTNRILNDNGIDYLRRERVIRWGLSCKMNILNSSDFVARFFSRWRCQLLQNDDQTGKYIPFDLVNSKHSPRG